MLEQVLQAFNELRNTETFEENQIAKMDSEYTLIKSKIDTLIEDEHIELHLREDELKRFLRDIVANRDDNIQNPELLRLTRKVLERLGWNPSQQNKLQ